MHQILRDGIADVGARLESKAALKEGRFDAEVRSLYRDKPLHEKLNEIQAAIETDDSATLAAFLLAPKALTGIEPDLVNRYRSDYQQRKAPAEFAEMQSLHFALSDSVLAIGEAKKYAANFADAESLDRFNAEAQKAADALKQLDDSMGG